MSELYKRDLYLTKDYDYLIGKRIIEYDIKLWVFLIRHGNEILKEKNRMNLLVKNCISILLNDCGGKGELIGQKNLQRVINMLSLLIAISGQYKEEAQNMKEIVELFIPKLLKTPI